MVDVGWTPLHRAAFQGDLERVRALLEDGADVDPPARDGWTPLMSACLEGHAEVVQELRARGAKAEIAGARLAVLACASGDLNTARIFFPEKIVNRDAALFFLAAHARLGHRMVKLTDAGSSDGDMVGYSSSWNERWAINARLELPPEEMAFLGDSVAVIEAELCVGGINFTRSDAVVAIAPPGLCSDFADRHLYIGALAPHWHGDGQLPKARLELLLQKAVWAGDVDVVDVLVAEVGKPAEALFAAVYRDDPLMVARLVDDPHVRERAGLRLTPLGVAARQSRPRAASALLENGAHVERAGDQTPLLHAVEKIGDAALDVVITLLEHGARPEAVHTKKGWTPLIRAAFMGDVRIVERLLRAGANPNARDKQGMSALRHGGGHRDIEELLRGFGAVD